MNKLKLSIVLAMLFCVVLTHAQTFEVDGISYSVTKAPDGQLAGEVEVTGGEIKEEIEIPESVTYNYNTYRVTSIGKNAFSGRTSAKRYIIPGTVKTIGDCAFYDNISLQEVRFNEGLQTIGAAAFAYNFALKEIRLPSTLLSIGGASFLTNQDSDIPVYCSAATPPNIDFDTFSGRTTGALHVSADDVEAYEEAEYWKDFSEIVGDIDDVVFTDRCFSPVFTFDNGLLTMSCKTEGASIYYTTDGSIPDENAIRYTSPISYTTNPVIRAIAIADGYENSIVCNFSNQNYIESITNVIDEQGLYYTLKVDDDNNFYYSVTGHSDELNSEIVIPEDLEGFPVKKISWSAFAQCENILSITIPNSVTTIEGKAFVGCKGLTSVIIGNRLKTIESQAFRFCFNLSFITIPCCVTTIDEDAFDNKRDLQVKVIVTDYSEYCNNVVVHYFGGGGHSFLPIHLIDKEGNEIREFIIPQGVKTIGNYAFANCRDLISITIPNSITNIGNSAFRECSSLTSVTIPSSVTTIDEVAFYECGNLSSVTIPSSVTSIGSHAFYQCSGLKQVVSEISIPFVVDAFNSFDAILVIPQGSRADYKGVSGWNFAFTFEEGETVYDRELTDEQGLCYTLRHADDGSFYYSVTGHSDEMNSEIEIPADFSGCPVKTIEDNAFKGCSSLTSISMPNCVTSIGARTFANCSNLTNIILNSQLMSIGEYAFHNCTSLSTIIIPDNVTTIGVFAFYGCSGLTSITIGSGLTSLEAGVFYGCSGLNTIQIPNSITIIEDASASYNFTGTDVRWGSYGVFSDCSGISSVIIGSGVTHIGNEAFSNCSSLTSVKIGKNVSSIGNNAFSGCASLTSITLPNTLESIGEGAFSRCSSLTTVSIPNSVTTIEKWTFWGCGSLTSIVLGDQLMTIGDYALKDCIALSSITIPNSVTNLGKFVFLGCKGLTSVIIGNSVTSFKAGLFMDCSSLSTIEIPNSVTTIEDAVPGFYISPDNYCSGLTYAVFAGCSNLTTLTIGSGVTHIGSYAFLNCRALTSVIIGENVNSIGEYAFWSCNSLTSIKLPNALESIGEYAFPMSMKSIELPNSFTIIPDKLFIDNYFQYIKLGNNVKSIGKYAFGSNELVLEISTSTPPTIDTNAFPGIENLSDINVIVPDTKAETAYRNANVWKEMTFSNQNNIAEVTVDIPGDLSWELYEECNLQPAKVVALKVNGIINADDFTQMRVNMKSLLRLDLSNCEITEIPDEALIGKTQLHELILPNKLITIGRSAFQNCYYLQELTMQTGLQTIGQNAFRGCNNLTGQLDLPSTVISIGESAFVGTGYTSVKMPSTLITIGNYAFNNLPIKQKMTLPKKVTSVGAYAFAGTKITGLEIPDGMTSIGDYAFAESPIQGHVTIPDGVTSLGRGAFRNTQISTVFLPNSIETLSEGLFQGCQNLDLVYVPDNYTSLASSAFDGCGALQILRLSANLASMGQYALQSTPLEYLKIPSQVETLSKGVLKNCKNLESLSLPANLKTVEGEAFYGCTALRNLSVEAIDPPAIRDRSAISGINTDLCLISIPTKSYKKYVLAEYWGQFVQMRNDIAVETTGNGEIAFESVEEGEDEEEVQAAPRRAAARASRRGQQLATDEESMTYANNGSSIYVPQQGKVRFYIIPAEGEEILSATLDGEDIMPYIVDGVYTATADKRNAKLVVVFSTGGQGSAGLQGDVNGDGTVSVTDVGCVINYILEQVPETFIYAAADMNGDESISVTDVGYIINYILSDGADYNRAANHATYSYGVPMLMPNTDGYVLTLDGADAFIGFQMDVLVPEDADGFGVQLKNTGTDHQMAYRRLGNGQYRVVCYSPTNETFQKGLTDLLTFTSESNITISNIRFTTAGLEEVRFADMGATPTGIANVTGRKTNDIKVYTLDGRLYRTVHVKPGENPLKDLQPGVYLINEHKYIVR